MLIAPLKQDIQNSYQETSTDGEPRIIDEAPVKTVLERAAKGDAGGSLNHARCEVRQI